MENQDIIAQAKTAYKALRTLRPEGLVNLVAIKDGKVLSTTENIKSKKAYEFIENHLDSNLYFSPNEPKAKVESKLKKTDIQTVHYLYADLDPAKDKDFTEERSRLKEIIENISPEIKPTTVVDSGGGYQLYWKIKATDVNNFNPEPYNRSLAEQLGGDHVYNIDRILRIPGTTNYPNETKRKAGRTTTTSSVVSELSSDRGYSTAYISKHIKPKHKEESSNEEIKFDIDLSPTWTKRLERMFNKVHKQHEYFREIWDGVRDYPSRSERDMAVAAYLRNQRGFRPEDISALIQLREENADKRFTKREISRTISRANPIFSESIFGSIEEEATGRDRDDRSRDHQAEPTNSDILGSSGRCPLQALGLVTHDQVEQNDRTTELFRRLIGKNTITALYGPSGSGKSFLALELSMCLALKKDFSEHRYKSKDDFAVLYIAAEAGEGLKRRVRALKRKHGIDPSTPAKDVPFVYYPIPVDMTDPTDQDYGVPKVEQLINETELFYNMPVGLVVLDTFSQSFTGDENSAEAVGKYINHLKRLQSTTDATYMIVHHTGKDEKQGMRGSSKFIADLDTTIRAKCTKRGEHKEFTYYPEKSKDDESDREGIPFALHQVEVYKDEDGDPITSCQVFFQDDEIFNAIAPEPTDGLSKEDSAIYYSIEKTQDHEGNSYALTVYGMLMNHKKESHASYTVEDGLEPIKQADSPHRSVFFRRAKALVESGQLMRIGDKFLVNPDYNIDEEDL